jgi:hypothetical protein
LHSVVETRPYLADTVYAGIDAAARAVFLVSIAAHPAAGDIIQRTGGARTVRVRRDGTRKSGGYPVIVYFGGDDVPEFLLSVVAKGGKTNLSQAERNAMRAELSGLAAAEPCGAWRGFRGCRADFRRSGAGG